MKTIKGITISQMAEELKLDKNAVMQRLFTARIKPITREALYDLSAWEIINKVPGRGRPKKVSLSKKSTK